MGKNNYQISTNNRYNHGINLYHISTNNGDTHGETTKPLPYNGDKHGMINTNFYLKVRFIPHHWPTNRLYTLSRPGYDRRPANASMTWPNLGFVFWKVRERSMRRNWLGNSYFQVRVSIRGGLNKNLSECWQRHVLEDAFIEHSQRLKGHFGWRIYFSG